MRATLLPACASRAAAPVAAARARRSAVVVRAAAQEDGRDPTGLSSLRFAKPDAAEMENLMIGWAGRSCNHEHAGASASAPDLPEGVKKGGFMVTTTRKRVGEGRKAYDAAIQALKGWDHLQLGWNCTTKPPLRKGVTICSATQTLVPWSVLPAQVVYCEEAPAEFGPADKGRRFAVGMCSLSGHQLAGEERFSVELHADGSVWYDVYLFSKPDTLLAAASLPVVKLQQIRYVNDSAQAVAVAVRA